MCLRPGRFALKIGEINVRDYNLLGVAWIRLSLILHYVFELHGALKTPYFPLEDIESILVDLLKGFGWSKKLFHY